MNAITSETNEKGQGRVHTEIDSLLHTAAVVVQPLRRPVQVSQHSIVSAAGSSIVQVTCDADLVTTVRELDNISIGPRQWLVADLTRVSSATRCDCTSLLAALDRVSPNRFCVAAAPRSPWVAELLPKRARRVTFQSVGDALQMLVLAEEGFGAAWLGSALVRPIELDVTPTWLARCPLAPRAVAAARNRTP